MAEATKSSKLSVQDLSRLVCARVPCHRACHARAVGLTPPSIAGRRGNDALDPGGHQSPGNHQHWLVWLWILMGWVWGKEGKKKYVGA